MAQVETTPAQPSLMAGTLTPWGGHVRSCDRTATGAGLAIILLVGCGLVRIASSGPSAWCGLEQWFAWGLECLIGPNPFSLLPLTVALLAGWWYRSGQGWRIPASTWPGVLAESAVIGLILTMLVRAARLVWIWPDASPWQAAGGWLASVNLFSDAAVVISAAVHEEVYFRLLLLGGAMAVARRWRLKVRLAGTCLTAGCALLFASLHFLPLNPAGQPFHPADFVCHFLLAALLGTLFLTRGLALAIGVHCAYNLMSLC